MNNESSGPGHDRLLKIPEVAEEMRADEKTVYRRIQSGRLKAQKEGGRWLVWRSVLLAYLGKPNGGQVDV